jgi:exopolysaccharide biosynthesis polyprenyl glycosylphosphotransferase
VGVVETAGIPPMIETEVPEGFRRLEPRIAPIRRSAVHRRRGGLVRRSLVAADLLGLASAYVLAQLVVGSGGGTANRFGEAGETILFLATLPVWVAAARMYGLYDRDEERVAHGTFDDLARVLHLVTVGAWAVYALGRLSGLANPDLPRIALFWLLAIAFVTGLRTVGRGLCRRRLGLSQNAVIVGAGDIGQLVAHKLIQHPEYGINVVGFLDAHPREQRADLAHLSVLGPLERLPELIPAFEVDRVIVAFSNDTPEEVIRLVREIGGADVQVDIVPRLFDLVGPNVMVHTIENMPLVGLPAARLAQSALRLKRVFDIVGALAGLLLAAPLFPMIALLIKLDSPGPVLFRQKRLGFEMREFEILKFRTMTHDVDPSVHEEFIRQTPGRTESSDGAYKLAREDAVTRVGRFLRRTSLDELPQFWNVLRGDMALVGPRPCLPYEVDIFEPHHFERFLMPAGVTGLWQVRARARSSFKEALEMDVAYVRGWSMGLDVSLLCRTPLQLLHRGATS